MEFIASDLAQYLSGYFYKESNQEVLPCVHICIAVEVFPSEEEDLCLVYSLLAECLAVVHPVN